MEQLSPCLTTTEPVHLEPVFCNKRSHRNEKPSHHKEEQSPLTTTRESPGQQGRPSKAKKKKKKKIKKSKEDKKASLMARIVKNSPRLRPPQHTHTHTHTHTQCKRPEFDPWVRKIPWRRREWLLTPVFLPGISHGQRSLVDYNSWGCKESDTT